MPLKMSWIPNFARCNPVPSFPDTTGRFTVGTTDIELPVSSLPKTVEPPANLSIPTVAYRLFYPCAPPNPSAPPSYWIQKPQRETVSAYARFLGASSSLASFFSWFPQLLYRTQLPAHRDAPLASPPLRTEKPSSTPGGRWPVLIFSHGLGGSRNAYSYICSSLASHGIVVVAVDHRDGSQAISYVRTPHFNGGGGATIEKIPYRPIPHTDSPETFHARDEQLGIRIWEISMILESLVLLDNPGPRPPHDLHTHKSDPNILHYFQDKLHVHVPGAVIFAGHSFGAATTVQLIKSAHFHPTITTPLFKPTSAPSSSPPKRPAILNQIKPYTPTILLDPWALPLTSASLATLPLPCFTSSSSGSSSNHHPGGHRTLAILSEAFFLWRPNFLTIKRLLAPPPPSPDSPRQKPILMFYPRHSAHLSQSDFGVVFPALTRYFARVEEPERTLRLNVWACVEMLRGCGVRVEGMSEEVLGMDVEDVEEGGGGDGANDGEEEEDFVLLDRPGRQTDEAVLRERMGRILQGKEGAVRGWVPVDLADGEVEADGVVLGGCIGGGRGSGVTDVLGEALVANDTTQAATNTNPQHQSPAPKTAEDNGDWSVAETQTSRESGE